MLGGGGAPRIGLVLAAGGIIGHAFHAGVLAALADQLGWEANQAEVIVGTSAGSAVAAILRAGLPAADLAARDTGDPLSAEGRRLLDSLGPPLAPPPREVARSGRRLGMAAPEMLARLALRPWDARLGTVASAMLPEGAVVNHSIDALGRLYREASWPSRPTWICAVRLRDGRRVVFGRDPAPQCTIVEAVRASCAIPGWFAPVVIAGERHVDGGAHSASNLDVLAGAGLDLVVAVSPMSVERGALTASADAVLRRGVGLRLAEERLRVRARGTPVVAVEPGRGDLEAMGPVGAAMDPARRDGVTRRARETMAERLRRPDLRRALTPLRG